MGSANFKRPVWLVLFFSIGCLVLGYAGMMLATPDPKGSPDLQWLTLAGGLLLMIVGATGFVTSMVWWFIAGIVAALRSRRQNHTEKS
jgi:CDP-diglyceride synthetase